MKKFECGSCKSTNTYTLIDGTKVCRRCGEKTVIKKIRKEATNELT